MQRDDSPMLLVNFNLIFVRQHVVVGWQGWCISHRFSKADLGKCENSHRSQKALLTYSRGMLKRLFSFDVQHDIHDFPLRVVDVTKNLATSFASKTC